jgi:N utilization substance protein B
VRRTDQRRAAVVALYQADVTGRPLIELVGDSTPFSKELAVGTWAERERLDEIIERHATDWSVDRIAPLERNILRLALFELLHRPDIPAEVAINEAIEAAKELCSADAPGFVNGVLGAAHREEVATR